METVLNEKEDSRNRKDFDKTVKKTNKIDKTIIINDSISF